MSCIQISLNIGAALGKNIAEAITLLDPELRDKILETVVFRENEDALLNEMIQSLEPEQISVILADYLQRQNNKICIIQDAESRSFVEHLIHSPEHFQILEPMLMDECNRRGMNLSNYSELLGPLCGDYFSFSSDSGLSSASSDKVMIYKSSGSGDENFINEIEDLLDTIEDEKCEQSLRILREEIIELETDPRVYSDILGRQVFRSATEMS